MPWEHQISPDHDDFNTPNVNVNACARRELDLMRHPS